MKTLPLATSVLAFIGTVGAGAQPAPSPESATGPGAPPAWRDGHPIGPFPFPRPRATIFRLKRGDAEIIVKCAEDEPTKACAEAASQFLDKAAASR